MQPGGKNLPTVHGLTRLIPFVSGLLGVWELAVGVGSGSGLWATTARVFSVLLLLGLPRWPIPVAVASLVTTYWVALAPSTAPSFTIVVALAICAYLVATRARAYGYVYAALGIGILVLTQPSARISADLAAWMFVFTLAALVGELGKYVEHSMLGVRRDYTRRTREQRQAIARELHDTTAYDLTALIMTLERAKIRGIAEPVLARDVDHMIALGRQSVANLRSVLHLLREESSPTEPETAESWPLRSTAPLDTVLDEAEDTLRRAGLDPSVTYTPAGIPTSLSVRTVLMRTIQECAANMVKYARPGSECLVMLEEGPDQIRAAFVNELGAERRPDADLGSGLGLVGVRERVTMIGGEFSARQTGEKWIAQVVVPRPGTYGALDRA